MSQFLLRELTAQVDMQTQEGRAHLLQAGAAAAAQVAAPALSLMLRKRLAELAGISQAELEELFQIKSTVQPAQGAAEGQTQSAFPGQQMLQLLLVQPNWRQGCDMSLLGEGSEELKHFAACLVFLRQPSAVKGCGAGHRAFSRHCLMRRCCAMRRQKSCSGKIALRR